MNQLPNNFYTCPEFASITMTRKDLKELLLATNGKTISQGRLRTIVSKHLGAGIYEVKFAVLKEKMNE